MNNGCSALQPNSLQPNRQPVAVYTILELNQYVDTYMETLNVRQKTLSYNNLGLMYGSETGIIQAFPAVIFS